MGLGGALLVDVLSGCGTASSEAEPATTPSVSGVFAVNQCVNVPALTRITDQYGNQQYTFSEPCALRGNSVETPADGCPADLNTFQPGEAFTIQCAGPDRMVIVRPATEGRGPWQ